MLIREGGNLLLRASQLRGWRAVSSRGAYRRRKGQGFAYINVSSATSGRVPTRIGGPHVPAPYDVYTCNSPNLCSP